MMQPPMSQDRALRYLTGTLNYSWGEAVNAVNGAAAVVGSTYQLARHQVRWARPGVYVITEAPDPHAAGCCHEPGGREIALAPGCEAGAARTRHLGHTHLGNGPVPGCPGCRPETLRPAPESSAALNPDLAWLLHVIPVVDQHLDDAAPAEYRDNPLANMWRRFSAGPVSEAAEAIDALIGMSGGNPRKGVTHTRAELLAEAADTAFSALLAIQSQTKDIAATWAVFTEAAAKAYGRVPDAERPS